MPSESSGGFTRAISHNVGKTSQKAEIWSETLPEAILEGQLAIIGTLIPPSFTLPFPYPCSLLKGPPLSNQGEPVPPLYAGPLSLEKIIRVFSYIPRSLSCSTSIPT